MAQMTYGEQLKHPNWQRRRLQRLEAASWKCQACEDGSTTLHVHHKRYVKGRLAWEYGDEELVVLCDPCHEIAHETRTKFLHLLCFTESFSPAGITEHDLLALSHAFLFAAAGGAPGADSLLDIDLGRHSTRSANVGFIAAKLYDSDLSEHEICDLDLVLGTEGFPKLRALIAQARAELDEEVRRDLDARNKESPD